MYLMFILNKRVIMIKMVHECLEMRNLMFAHLMKCKKCQKNFSYMMSGLCVK